MDRLVLTVEQQALVDAFRLEHASDLDREVLPGTNLVIDDHLQIDNSWYLVVLCASGGNACQVYIPQWDYQCDLWIDFVTDRAGPNGEIMPIETELQKALRLAAKEGGVKNPNDRASVVARRLAFLNKQTASVKVVLTSAFVQHGLLTADEAYGPAIVVHSKHKTWFRRVVSWLKSLFSF